mgnify:CR=1 FL=1
MIVVDWLQIRPPINHDHGSQTRALGPARGFSARRKPGPRGPCRPLAVWRRHSIDGVVDLKSATPGPPRPFFPRSRPVASRFGTGG